MNLDPRTFVSTVSTYGLKQDIEAGDRSAPAHLSDASKAVWHSVQSLLFHSEHEESASLTGGYRSRVKLKRPWIWP